ncbi:hypothetical protein [Acutalibacter intestini]|uniref:hypothetical protein n=1 Tax=Acutalibacter intestini TaxID=3093659 RepID=UPI002AC9C496|nr:hypothetical protein [Acutalibacter sp. M00204]
MKKKKWLIVLAVMAIVLVLVIGIPLIINKLYKMGPGFVTVWDGADMLSYYGTLLGDCGAVIGVLVYPFCSKELPGRRSCQSITIYCGHSSGKKWTN